MRNVYLILKQCLVLIMDKTIGYFFEKLIGLTVGLIISIYVFYKWPSFGIIYTDKYYDLIMKSSASIFGFLLTILVFINNGSNTLVTEMKKHGSYIRLINFNKSVVLLCFFIIILSLVLVVIVFPERSYTFFLSKFTLLSFKIIVSSHILLCIWCAIDTFIFLRIFYSIITNNALKK